MHHLISALVVGTRKKRLAMSVICLLELAWRALSADLGTFPFRRVADACKKQRGYLEFLHMQYFEIHLAVSTSIKDCAAGGSGYVVLCICAMQEHDGHFGRRSLQYTMRT